MVRSCTYRASQWGGMTAPAIDKRYIVYIRMYATIYPSSTYERGCHLLKVNKGVCLSPLRLCNRTPHTGQLINNRHLFLPALEAGPPRSRCRQIQCLVRTQFLASSCWVLT